MRIKRLNEKVDNNWERVFLSIYDSFLELEERNICDIRYFAGLCWLNELHISQMNFFQIKNGEIVGDRGNFDLLNNSDNEYKMLFKVEIVPNILDQSPFKSAHSPSFYGKDAGVFIKIIKYAEAVKNRHRDYKLDISIHNNSTITLTFKEL